MGFFSAVGAVTGVVGAVNSYKASEDAADAAAESARISREANRYRNAIQRRRDITTARIRYGTTLASMAATGVGSQKSSGQISAASSIRSQLGSSMLVGEKLDQYGARQTALSLEAQQYQSMANTWGAVSTLGMQTMSMFGKGGAFEDFGP